MRIETRWLRKPSLILFTLICFSFLIQIQPCNSIESQNRTLSETTTYHFDSGLYNVIKQAENSETSFRIIQETKIPYINITYIAPEKGLLQITLKSIEGDLPYIELSTGWDTDGFTYIKPMHYNETSYFLITPALRLSDENRSTIAGGEIILWENYRWENTSGIINYTFTTSEDINFDLVLFPTQPKQGEQISFFTTSNSELCDITWNFPELNWVNITDVLNINDLEPGNYSVIVTCIDYFNESHSAQTTFNVSPPSLNTQSIDLGFFSVTYSETVTMGEQINLSTTIDYSIPFPALIQCELIDPINNVTCKSLVYNVSESGSKQFNHQFIAEKEGVKPLILRLYYNIGSGWTEVSEAETNLSIIIKKTHTSTTIPGYNPIMILIGITLVTFLSIRKKDD